MKNFNNVLTRFMITVLSLVMVLGFMAPIAVSGQNEEPITFTDMADRDITLDEPADEIVVLQPSNAEILYAIGAGDTIVGRGEYVDYPVEEVEDIPTVGTGENTNIEEIIALNPDIVITTTMGQAEDQLSQLEVAGITVIVTDASSIAEVYEAIELLGLIVGHNEEAEQVIMDMQTTFDEYTKMADESEIENASVYYEISPLEFGLWTGGKNTFMDEIGAMLNLENIFVDVEGWAEVSEEQVLERTPDYIITTTMPYDGMDPVEEILNRVGWDEVTAVKEGNVLQANSDEFTRPGPRLAEAVKTLYNFVHGE